MANWSRANNLLFSFLFCCSGELLVFLCFLKKISISQVQEEKRFPMNAGNLDTQEGLSFLKPKRKKGDFWGEKRGPLVQKATFGAQGGDLGEEEGHMENGREERIGFVVVLISSTLGTVSIRYNEEGGGKMLFSP